MKTYSDYVYANVLQEPRKSKIIVQVYITVVESINVESFRSYRFRWNRS